MSSPTRVLAALGCVLLLSLVTVFNQVKTRGLSVEETAYRAELANVLDGGAAGQSQYRVLSSAVALSVANLFEILGMPRATGIAFVLLRLAQNMLIGVVALLYYRRLGLDAYLGLLGLSALAWGMTQSNTGGGLAFDIYTEILLFLAAGWAAVAGRFAWGVPLTLLAALNREGAALMPVMLLAVAWTLPAGTGARRRATQWALAALLTWCVVTAGLRLGFGSRAWDEDTGFTMAWHNLSGPQVWGNLAGTLTILPILAFAAWGWWPRPLRAIAVAVLPAWFGALPFLVPMEETRHVLMPLALVFAPGTLCGLTAAARGEETP